MSGKLCERASAQATLAAHAHTRPLASGSNLSADLGAMLRSSVDEALASSSMAADLQNLRDEVAALRQQADERAMVQDGYAAALQVADGASGQLSAADHKLIVEISQALGLEWSLPAEATPADVLEAAHIELGLETPVGSVREQLQALREHEGLADDLARHAEVRRSFHDGEAGCSRAVAELAAAEAARAQRPYPSSLPPSHARATDGQSSHG